MLLLLLAACGYPSYYPNPGFFAVDTGDGPPSMPCGDTWAFEGVVLRAVSTAPVALDLYQVDSTCVETWLGSLAATPPLTVDAMPGSVFAARERAGGAIYDWLQVPYGHDTYIWEVR